MKASWIAVTSAVGLTMACTTAGSTWMAQPLAADDEFPRLGSEDGSAPSTPPAAPKRAKSRAPDSTALGDEDGPPPPAKRRGKTGKLEGKVLGKFRNTYYDFPDEDELSKGAKVALKNPKCETIKDVSRSFYEAVCVQGSGTLSGGQTVSFAKRDCECAEICPRTSQKICFDSLDSRQFPYGRGATGQPITPLFTVAVDSNVIPLGTPIYVPEYDGLPRDVEETGLHDGCFIAQDRGLRVKGNHVDVFTGHSAITQLWNRLVPSNQGVTVVTDSPHCARAGGDTGTAAAATSASPPSPPEPADKPAKKRKNRDKEKRD